MPGGFEGIGNALTTGSGLLASTPFLPPAIGAPLAAVATLGASLGFGAAKVPMPPELRGWPYAPGRILWGLPMLERDRQWEQASLRAGSDLLIRGWIPDLYSKRPLAEFFSQPRDIDTGRHSQQSGRAVLLAEDRIVPPHNTTQRVWVTRRWGFGQAIAPSAWWSLDSMSEDDLGTLIEAIVAHVEAHRDSAVNAPTFHYLPKRSISFQEYTAGRWHDWQTSAAQGAAPLGFLGGLTSRVTPPPPYELWRDQNAAVLGQAHGSNLEEREARWVAELARWADHQQALEEERQRAAFLAQQSALFAQALELARRTGASVQPLSTPAVEFLPEPEPLAASPAAPQLTPDEQLVAGAMSDQVKLAAGAGIAAALLLL